MVQFFWQSDDRVVVTDNSQVVATLLPVATPHSPGIGASFTQGNMPATYQHEADDELVLVPLADLHTVRDTLASIQAKTRDALDLMSIKIAIALLADYRTA